MSIHLTKLRIAVAIACVVALVPATAVATHVFDDVDDNRFFAVPVEWAADNGITTGTSPTTFSPDDPVTRGESVTFLNRYDTNIVQPALANTYTQAEVDAAIAATTPKLYTVTVEDTIATTFTPGYVPVAGMELDIEVPPGGPWQALITFSAESNCGQNPVDALNCFVRVLVDGSPSATPTEALFDSVVHGPNDIDITSWGSHSNQFTQELQPGTHTIDLEFTVTQTLGGFGLGRRTLSVQLFPA